MNSSDHLLGFDDAYAIGTKIVEMAERVDTANKIVPGAAGNWGFEMDGKRYSIRLTQDVVIV